jgi:hypothetical protein
MVAIAVIRWTGEDVFVLGDVDVVVVVVVAAAAISRARLQ